MFWLSKSITREEYYGEDGGVAFLYWVSLAWGWKANGAIVTGPPAWVTRYDIYAGDVVIASVPTWTLKDNTLWDRLYYFGYSIEATRPPRTKLAYTTPSVKIVAILEPPTKPDDVTDHLEGDIDFIP